MGKFRHEIKFKLNYGKYIILRSILRNIMNLDNNSGETGEYVVTSLYFDDIYNTALYEKALGINDREKYRIRVYNDSDSVILLEKKVKSNNYVAKEKIKLSKADYYNILNNNLDKLDKLDLSNSLLKELTLKAKQKLLKPVVIVRYNREAYIEKNGNVRITFDKRLETGINNIDLLKKDSTYISAFENNEIILEVKYDEYLPQYIRDALKIDGISQQSISKYTICRKYMKRNGWEDN